MKAVTCKEHGLPDKLELVLDWPEPEVGEHDVLTSLRCRLSQVASVPE
jgi:NADPH2:quinone reductase